MHNEFFSKQHYAAAYRFATPPAALAPWVEFSWESSFGDLVQAPEASLQERSFAQLSSSIVFNEGDTFHITVKGSPPIEVSEAVIIGHHSQPIVFSHTKENRLFGLKLRPGGFYHLLGIPAGLIRDSIVPLRDLGFAPLQPNQNMEAMYRFVQQSPYRTDAYKLQSVQQALDLYLAQVHNSPKVEQVAWELHLGAKTLNRYFHETLGIGPRKAFSIARIRAALKAYAGKRPGTSFSVYDFGYTDHSHFYKDLSKYTALHSLENLR
jgi:AraC-like DNA-binding protein